MKRLAFGAMAAVMLAGLWHTRPLAQSACLHGSDEDATQRARRMVAVKLVRAINTAESNEARRTNRYSPLKELMIDLSSAEGFKPQFTTDGDSYALLLSDTTDQCRFTLSTNQNGAIFQGYPLDYAVQPISR